MGSDTIDNRTSDTLKLLNYGFNNYKLNILYNKNKKVGKIKINNSKNLYYDVYLENDASVLENKDNIDNKYKINIKLKDVKAPFNKNKVVGVAEILNKKNEVLFKENIIVRKKVEKANIIDYFCRNIKKVLSGI